MGIKYEIAEKVIKKTVKEIIISNGLILFNLLLNAYSRTSQPSNGRGDQLYI